MYKILKSISEVGPLSMLSEVRQVSKGLHCVNKVVVTGNCCVNTMLQPSLQILFLLWAEIYNINFIL